jgi:hypothetical protein
LFARPSFPGCGWLLFGYQGIIGVKAPVVLGGCFVWLAIIGSIDVKYSSSFGFVAIADRHIQITNGLYGDYYADESGYINGHLFRNKVNIYRDVPIYLFFF